VVYIQSTLLSSSFEIWHQLGFSEQKESPLPSSLLTPHPQPPLAKQTAWHLFRSSRRIQLRTMAASVLFASNRSVLVSGYLAKNLTSFQSAAMLFMRCQFIIFCLLQSLITLFFANQGLLHSCIWPSPR
jgi:hypothetical protein